MNGLIHSGLERLFDLTLEWREAGAAAHEDHRPRRVLVEHEAPQRRLDAQDRACLHLSEYPVSELTAIDMADVQFDVLVIVRRIGDRKGTLAAIGKDEIEILSGHELQALVFRQLEQQAHDVVAQVIDGVHTHGQQLDLDVGCRLGFTHTQRDIARGETLAWQALARTGLFERRRRAVVGDLAADQIGGAGTAAAVAAAIRQSDVLPDRSIQYRLVVFNVELVAAGAEGDGESHRLLLFGRKDGGFCLISASDKTVGVAC